MNIIIAIVNYNSINATKRMLVSANILNIKPDIYILDNNSNTEIEVNFNPQEYYSGQSYYIRLKKNHGYFGAISVFLSMIEGTPFDWLFIANSDLTFNDPALFDYLGVCMRSTDGTVGIYCPSILSNRTKLDQNPFLWKKPGKYYYYKYRFLASNYYVSKAYAILSRVKSSIRRLKIQQDNINKKPKVIFAPHGAFIGINKEYFNQGGYLEYRNFLFNEEEILGFICDRINLKVIYDPRVEILHDEHVVTGSGYSKEKHANRVKSLNILKEYIL